MSERQTASLFHWLPIYGLILLLLAFVSFGLALATTHRRKAEEERLPSEKFKSVLEMAGAVCHEMNQPMQVVSGTSELLMMDVEDDSLLYDNIKTVKEQIDRMGKKQRNL